MDYKNHSYINISNVNANILRNKESIYVSIIISWCQWPNVAKNFYIFYSSLKVIIKIKLKYSEKSRKKCENLNHQKIVIL